jgi:hypothetical protein
MHRLLLFKFLSEDTPVSYGHDHPHPSSLIAQKLSSYLKTKRLKVLKAE